MEQSSSSVPGISIVTPSFNQARFLRSCIELVRRQTAAAVEHLIFDPGSTDGSRENDIVARALLCDGGAEMLDWATAIGSVFGGFVGFTCLCREANGGAGFSLESEMGESRRQHLSAATRSSRSTRYMDTTGVTRAKRPPHSSFRSSLNPS